MRRREISIARFTDRRELVKTFAAAAAALAFTKTYPNHSLAAESSNGKRRRSSNGPFSTNRELPASGTPNYGDAIISSIVTISPR